MHVVEASGATVKRRKLDGTQHDVACPDYQAYMRGVDRGDQLIGFYSAGRRSKKWWKIIFWNVQFSMHMFYIVLCIPPKRPTTCNSGYNWQKC